MIRNGGPFLSVLSFQNRSKLQLKALCSELFIFFLLIMAMKLDCQNESICDLTSTSIKLVGVL